MYIQRRQNKYGNKKRDYGGILYDSIKEAAYAQELDLREKAGDIKSWERQVRISLDINGKHICNYFIDFVITHNDDHLEYVEVKGFATPVWRLKWKLFEAIYNEEHPGVELTVVN